MQKAYLSNFLGINFPTVNQFSQLLWHLVRFFGMKKDVRVKILQRCCSKGKRVILKKKVSERWYKGQLLFPCQVAIWLASTKNKDDEHNRASGKYVCEMYISLNPSFIYKKKTGVCRGIPIFALKHRLWVLVGTATPRWF